MTLNIGSYSSYLIYLAIPFAILFPDAAENLLSILPYILILIMAFSVTDFSFKNSTKAKIMSAIKLTALHYVFLSSLYIIASFFVKNQGYKEGLITLAIIPPAIGIIAIIKIKSQTIDKSFLALLSSYLFALVYAPVILYILLQKSVEINTIFMSFLLFILLPYILSRIIKKLEVSQSKNKIIVNCMYAFLFYIIIGSKIDSFKDIVSLWPLFLIMLILSFGIGTIIFTYFNKRKSPIALDLALFSTYKNTGLAAVVAVSIFQPDSLVPISIRALISPLYTLYILGWMSLKQITTEKKQKV